MRKINFLMSLLIFSMVIVLIRCAGPTASVASNDEPDAEMAAYHTDQYV